MSASFIDASIALPGDEVICPSCGIALARFLGPALCEAQLLPRAREVDAGQGQIALYCSCGDSPFKYSGPRRHEPIEAAPHPRMFVRSGSWTGWRALGGE